MSLSNTQLTLPSLSIHVLKDSSHDFNIECFKSLVNVKVVESPSIPGNLTQARLQAFSLQNTDWVGWVDSDDFVDLQTYQKAVSLIDSTTSLVTWDELIVNSKGRIVGKGVKYGENICAADIWKNPMVAHKCIVRKEAIPLAKEIIGDLPVGICFAVVLAATLIGDVKKVKEPLYYWRIHNNNSHKKQRPDLKQILSRFEEVKRRYVNGDSLACGTTANPTN